MEKKKKKFIRPIVEIKEDIGILPLLTSSDETDPNTPTVLDIQFKLNEDGGEGSEGENIEFRGGF